MNIVFETKKDNKGYTHRFTIDLAKKRLNVFYNMLDSQDGAIILSQKEFNKFIEKLHEEGFQHWVYTHSNSYDWRM